MSKSKIVSLFLMFVIPVALYAASHKKCKTEEFKWSDGCSDGSSCVLHKATWESCKNCSIVGSIINPNCFKYCSMCGTNSVGSNKAIGHCVETTASASFEFGIIKVKIGGEWKYFKCVRDSGWMSSTNIVVGTCTTSDNDSDPCN